MTAALASVAAWSGGAPAPLPDPVLSANLYCSGRLCEVIHRLVAPFWREARERAAEGTYLWLLRYARGGEHLKVRVHGLASERGLLRELLDGWQRRYFAALGPAEPGAARHSRPLATPIDAEDSAAADHPDRSLVWTTYGRSHISLGYRPFLDDDTHVALLTRCLGRGTEIVLDRWTSGDDGACPFATRQNVLLRSLVAGLAVPFPSGEERARYLLYHRDCLLRHVRKQRLREKGLSDESRSLASLLRRFDDQAAAPGPRLLGLREVALEIWQARSPVFWDPHFDAWHGAVAELAGYGALAGRDAAYQVDPFAESPAFPVLFKAFHGLANQAGLDPVNEAFCHHLLLSLTAGRELALRPVRMRPGA